MPVNVPPSRLHYDQHIHYFRAPIAYNTGAVATPGTVVLGTLPAGAIVTGGVIVTGTGFNAGTTNVVNIGTATTPAQVATGSVTAAGVITITPGLKVAVDTPLFMQYTQTGTAATAGAADVIVFFVPNNDR